MLDDQPRLFNGDKETPIVETENLEVEDVIALLFNPPTSHVCRRQPRKCQINASFIIDTRELAGPSDWKADDLGVFDNVGKVNMGYFLISSDHTATFLSKKKTEVLLPVPGQTIKATKTYWVHRKYKDFKRRAVELVDERNRRLPFVLVQYVFEDGREHAISSDPHKNSKKGKAEFLRTKPSLLQKLKTEVKSKKSAAEVYDNAFEDAGGILQFQTRGDLPRNIKQVSNLKYETSGPKKEKDELYAVLEKCQQEEVPFVRKLQLAPDPACILATDRQLNDVVRFCSAENMTPSVLGIDTTFNIGVYYVTPTTYRHTMLENRDRGRGGHPTLLGPTMFHSRRNETSFLYFASSLVSQKPDIANSMFIGSDREVAVRNGFNPFFPLVTWLSCFKHVEDDIKRKLNNLGIKDPGLQKEFLQDIFGNDRAEEKGLVDASSAEEFDAQLESLYSVWNEREKVARKLIEDDEAEFYYYFNRCIVNDMKSTMLKPVRQSAGLQEEFYYNNAPESMNARLKQRKKAIKTGKMPWLDGIGLVEALAQEQERNVERAIIDEGPYQLCSEFEHLKVDPEDWLKLSEREKLTRLSKLHGMKLTPASCSAVTPDVPGISSEASDINITELATRGLPKTVGVKPGSAPVRKRSRSQQAVRETDGYTPRASGSSEYKLYLFIITVLLL